MDAKISITTRCNGRCRTCPVWLYPGQDMRREVFTTIWRKLMASKDVGRILLNNTGDMYIHPDHRLFFDYIEQHHEKPVIMTTNALAMDRVPKIDVIVISFNGGTKEAYEYTTGMWFDVVTRRIRAHYKELERIPYVELDMLVWDGNAGTEEALLEHWRDFPGRIRVSYKYDNQMKEDHTLPEYRRTERIPCDYLSMLNIMPDGKVVSCAHDFKAETDFGNIYTGPVHDSVVHPARLKKIEEHLYGEYTGLCEKCNYNTPTEGRIVYLK